MDIVSLLIYYKDELERNVPKSIKKVGVLSSTQVRKSIKDELEMSNPVFNNTLSRLRKKGVLGKKNEVEPVLIPDITDKGFQLLINFRIDEQREHIGD